MVVAAGLLLLEMLLVLGVLLCGMQALDITSCRASLAERERRFSQISRLMVFVCLWREMREFVERGWE